MTVCDNNVIFWPSGKGFFRSFSFPFFWISSSLGRTLLQDLCQNYAVERGYESFGLFNGVFRIPVLSPISQQVFFFKLTTFSHLAEAH